MRDEVGKFAGNLRARRNTAEVEAI